MSRVPGQVIQTALPPLIDIALMLEFGFLAGILLHY
jgi:hypothetical protein